ncbi:Fructosamine kinase-domain-containing protein [Xylaria longipes]|nr:Fructosamine kinase-domain-containing protein [Xylaria longipes]
MAPTSQETRVLDVDRHGGESAPTSTVPKPQLGSSFDLDRGVIDALPVPGTIVISAHNYGMSLWGQTARIVAEVPGGARKNYFLKTIKLGETGRLMMEGEFESLKAIHSVSPDLAPQPYAWGKFKDGASLGDDTYFLLAQFREVGEQPPNPLKFTARLAEFHKKSKSPTGKFGFHITTCHAKLPQATDCWEDSWEALYKKQLAQMIRLDEEKHGEWPEFQKVCKLVLDIVIPRLLGPLQSEGRTIEPCLVHGDLWDENTATDMDTGEPFIFDAGSFYGHNEYEIGNWRSARHRLSDKIYVRNYKRNFPVSEPEDEWDDRNLLYSLRYDLGTAILIPGCNQRQVVKDNMTLLCKKFCPDELRAAQGYKTPASLQDPIGDKNEAEEEEEEEEEEDTD